MSNLDIRIKGLALCHLEENGDWRVFFPKVEDHDFKLIVQKTDTSNGVGNSREYALPTATRIDLIPDQTTDLPNAQNNLADSLDIFALHGEKLTLTPDISRYAGLLTLRKCFLQSRFSLDGALKVDVWETRQPAGKPTPENPPTKAWRDRREIATEFLSTFGTNPDSVIGISMQTDFDIEMMARLSVRQETGFKYTITFSNDCEGIHCENESDFKYFYNIIDETALQDQRRFELILVDPSKDRGRMGSPCGGIFAPGGKLYIPQGL